MRMASIDEVAVSDNVKIKEEDLEDEGSTLTVGAGKETGMEVQRPRAASARREAAPDNCEFPTQNLWQVKLLPSITGPYM